MSERFNHETGVPIQLLRWIRAQQQKEAEHKAYLVRQIAKDDVLFLDIMTAAAAHWDKLSKFDKLMVFNLFQYKEAGKNFTVKQRGFITGLYLKIK
jgi:hypothetical protein